MGSKVERGVKRVVKSGTDIEGMVSGTGLSFDVQKKFRSAIEKPFRTGKSKKAREAKRLTLLQTQREKARSLEAEDEIARRRGLASSKGAGRQSLIRSTGGNLAQSLGG